VTFKDLKKRITLEVPQQQYKLFDRLRNKSFWIWNIQEHKQEDVRTNGYCCFNHIIGLPTKGRIEKPIFDYEKLLYDCLLVNHIDAYRALDNPKFILIDEGDFFRKGEQEDVRHVSERYIAKSDPYIVMVSTPNAPDGLFEKLEKEPEETCMYDTTRTIRMGMGITIQRDSESEKKYYW